MPGTGLPLPDQRMRWWQYIGPWPLAPVPVATTMWFTAATFAIARLTAVESSLQPADYPPIFIAAAPAAVAAGLVMWLFKRLRSRLLDRSWLYWAAIASTVVTFVVIRNFSELLPSEGFSSQVMVVVAALARTSFTVVFMQTVLGLNGYRMAVQVARTDAALRMVREQQEQVLEADEQVRAQVSSLLHDRVQAGLIAACLELQDSAGRADPHTRNEITDVVHRLEELRGLDVRRAARTLSPNLEDADVESALIDLAAQYSPSMSVTVEVDRQIVAQATRPSQQLLLGAYRIIEQALLNCAVHGRARRCEVRIARAGDDVVVTVDDDGSGLPSTNPSPSVGTALTTTWVRILGGTWNRTSSPMGGVRVRAVLPWE